MHEARAAQGITVFSLEEPGVWNADVVRLDENVVNGFSQLEWEESEAEHTVSNERSSFRRRRAIVREVNDCRRWRFWHVVSGSRR